MRNGDLCDFQTCHMRLLEIQKDEDFDAWPHNTSDDGPRYVALISNTRAWHYSSTNQHCIDYPLNMSLCM